MPKMTPLIEQAPQGKESTILAVFDDCSQFAVGLEELVNHCVEYRLKIKTVEAPDSFKWPDPSAAGEMIEISNRQRNKLIITLTPA
jgi:hypothetical protein